MNKKWERKPSDNVNWKEKRVEDLFKCHICKNWYPWFKFCKGKVISFGDKEENTYSLMNDEEDRGGYKWSCDMCLDKFLFQNKIITITDREGKIINFD